MKKLFALLLALTMVLSLAACGSDKKDSAPEDEEIIENETSDEETAPEEETEEEAEEESEETEEESQETLDEKPAEKPAQKPAEKPAQKPAQKPAEKPAQKPAQKPAEKPAQKPAEKPAQKPADSASADQALLDKLASLVNGIDDEMTTVNEMITADTFEYNLFIPYVDGYRAAVSNPMIGSIAHTVVLLQLPDGTDAASVAADIKANMNPRKWICVEAEASWVKTSGQYVVMVMSSQELADAVAANFDTVFGA